ncbi:P-loop containing nucleoside triphosphate hydrolase protein [Mycena latifolia]|nr:P-loop containing nucleoside triphosphate hydrolase protein [Mycena latifolia]
MNNCPLPTRIFRGRKTIIDKMYHYFTRNRRTLSIFLLQGLGGVGKTQIALKFIQDARPHFTDIFLIDSSTVTTIETGLKFLAMTKSVGDSSEAALQWLKVNQDEWLLLFDNADDPKINLNNYFPQCSHGNIVITSRNPGLYAVDLLLRSAAQDTNVRNKETAALIVKTLCYLPLAIIQAGAFISKSGNLNSYLALYDNYPWTVYTTWQISFDQLSDQAKTFLKLCSYLHYQGISEDIFRNATTYQVESTGPGREELDMPLKILSQFLGPSGSWDPLSFMDVTNDLRAYSLINFDSEKCLFSIHPLVHEWIRSTLSDELHHHCMKTIVGMSLTRVSEGDLRHHSLLMLPHIDFLLKGNSHIISDFGHEYGKVYLFAGKPEKAEELEVVVLEKRRNILGEDDPNTLQAMYWLAWAYEHMAKWDKAEELGRIVLRKWSEILGENHPDTLEALGNLAIVCNKLGKLKESEELGVVLLQKSRNILGDNHPTTLAVMGNMVYTYNTLGRAHEAEKLGVAALEKRRNILGDNHPDTVTIMANLAVTYISLGKLQEAQELALAAFEKRTSILGENHPDTLITMGILPLERLQEAEALQVVVIEKRKDILGHNHPDTLSTIGNLAATYNKLGRSQEAMKLEAEVLEMRRKILGSNHPHTLRTMSNLGSTLNKLGKWKEAEDLLIEALKNQTEFL